MDIPQKLPIFFIPGGVVLPGVSARFKITSNKGIALIKSRLLNRSTLASTIVGIFPTDPDRSTLASHDENDFKDKIGTAAVVVQIAGTTWPKTQYTLLVAGIGRLKLVKLIQDEPYPFAQVKAVTEEAVMDEKQDMEVTELIESFRTNSIKFLELLDISVPTVGKLKKMLEQAPNHQLADIISALVNANYDEKIGVLNAIQLKDRFSKALPLLLRQIEGLKLLREKEEKNKNQRRILRKLQNENQRKLDADNDSDNGYDELQNLEVKLSQADLPKNVQKVASKELKRIKKMSPQMPEYPMLRHYLELISELPWNKSTKDNIDIGKARQELDADHYAMNEVKKRILEYLAVRKLKQSLRGPIMCFVGPPGVGKTSIGRSIANILGRKFHRISLGGISDQSEIRGHRRTYIGSMPGRFIQGLRTVGVNNPVFLLDEVDKMSSGVHGDPMAALLEVLDPEQNSTFVDHYLNVPFDLSQVIFIGTANSLATIPRPLKDRMEIIQIPGYTIEDKIPIGRLHLLPKQIQMHGLEEQMIQIPDESLKSLILNYTREAGVRELERKLAAVCRAIAVQMAEKDCNQSKAITHISSDTPMDMPIVLDQANIEAILGNAIYEGFALGKNARLGQIGVAVGLAWTSVGGEMMVIEATKMTGTGKLVLTGQLGDVMKESATLSLSWIRSNSKKLSLDFNKSLLSQLDVHIHFPEGAISKDGPSAGITITTALVSLFTEKPVAQDLAMTGEMTLRGLVLPVGGIKEKLIAAYRANCTKVLIPINNKKDVKGLPDHIQNGLEIIAVKDIEQVLEHAFSDVFDEVITLSKL